MRLAVALSLATLAALPARAQTQAPQPLRIGLIAPLSGGSADFGNSMRHGAALAVAEINAVGGYLGRPLELVVRDDKADPDTGRAMATELVTQQNVAYTIGYCNTGVALKSLDVFETHKHLLMVPCSTGTLITRKTPPAQSYVFRLAPAASATFWPSWKSAGSSPCTWRVSTWAWPHSRTR
jgi:branched-chain amino acid transport system substrate-binding protein